MNEINIAGRKIGLGYDPLVIAEIGINHGGDIKEAFKLVDAAYAAGAEIIKHQTHLPEFEMSEEAKKIIPVHAKENIFKIISDCSLSEKEEIKLKKYIQNIA